MRLPLPFALVLIVVMAGGAPAAAQDEVKTPEEYVKDLGHQDPTIRARALQMLGVLRKTEVTSKILTLMEVDKEADVRRAAVDALADLGAAHPEAVTA